MINAASKYQRAWGAQEDAAIRRHYRRAGATGMQAKLPGRSRIAIERRACALGVARAQISSSLPWTAKDLAVLRRYYPAEGGDVIARVAGRTRKAINQRAARLGVRYAGPHRSPFAKAG